MSDNEKLFADTLKDIADEYHYKINEENEEKEFNTEEKEQYKNIKEKCEDAASNGKYNVNIGYVKISDKVKQALENDGLEIIFEIEPGGYAMWGKCVFISWKDDYYLNW